MARIILLLDMDAFYAAVEERENPQFQGKPVVVGAEPKGGKGRGVVSTCNYTAREYGIHSAMPISEAWRLCPQAVFLPVNGRLYAEVSERIMGVITEVFPGRPLEQVSLDEAYVDLETWEKAREMANRLKKEIWERDGLRCTIGIGPNKMVAKVACEQAKPDGLLEIRPGEAEAFLAPLPVRSIPGVGPKTEQVLGSGTVEEARRFSEKELGRVLGKHGEELYWRLRGKDDSPVVPAAEQEVKSLGREYTFEQDTRDPEQLFPVFEELVEEVLTELRAGGYACRTIVVVCRFSGFETHTKSRTLLPPAREGADIRRGAVNLLLRFLLENSKPVRLVGVRLKV